MMGKIARDEAHFGCARHFMAGRIFDDDNRVAMSVGGMSGYPLEKCRVQRMCERSPKSGAHGGAGRDKSIDCPQKAFVIIRVRVREQMLEPALGQSGR